MRVLSEEDIESGDFADNSKARARRLKDIELDYDTGKHVGFVVRDDEKGTVHHVIYRSDVKPPDDWSCDCKWHATQGSFGRYCAHILAVNMKLNKGVKDGKKR